jgi:hypothetical protein
VILAARVNILVNGHKKPQYELKKTIENKKTKLHNRSKILATINTNCIFIAGTK